MLSASSIASGASVDNSVENKLSAPKKSINLDFEQKVEIDSEDPTCCHEFDLSNIINWQHISGGLFGNKSVHIPCLRSQFSFMTPIFFTF